MTRSLRIGLSLLIAAIVSTVAAAQTSPYVRVAPHEVLVLFNAAWPDEDGNGRSDSQDVATYYAERREIPSRNVLGLRLGDREAKADPVDYREFFQRVLVPARTRIAELGAAGTTIHYIVTCYGMPLTLRTHFDVKQGEHPIWKQGGHDADVRALTGWLVNLEENFQAGVDPASGKPGALAGKSAVRAAPPLGTALRDITLSPLHGLFKSPEQLRSFKTLRGQMPALRGVYLVTHLGGGSVETSKGLVDKALYAERYLRSFEDPAHPYYGRVWLDHDPGRDAGHRSSLLHAAAWFKGLFNASVYAPGNESQPWFKGRPWDVRMDNVSPEIGSRGADPPTPLHHAAAVATIESIDAASRVLTLATDKDPRDPAPAVFFPVGETIRSSQGGRAKVTEIVSEKALKVAAIEEFRAGDIIVWQHEGPFPLTDVVFYYGYYSVGSYFDVYQFRVGAVGAHMDSLSAVWARHAIERGITVTAGAINEPSSGGVPMMGQVFTALTSGHDVAEAFFAGTPQNTRWNTVVFGDPLYAPFRVRGKITDRAAPAIEGVTAQPLRSSAGGRRILIRAQLAGGDPEREADVALWQLEYGTSASYGTVVPYVEWPDPADSSFNTRRRYSYTRRFSQEIEATPGAEYHIRLSARDPFGNVGTATTTVTIPR